MHIDTANGGYSDPKPSDYAIEAGCRERMEEIGTNISAWTEAQAQLDIHGANMAALITDARLTDPNLLPVVSPGGYFRSMIKAGQRGELNLVGSFVGLVARRAKEEEEEWLNHEQ